MLRPVIARLLVAIVLGASLVSGGPAAARAGDLPLAGLVIAIDPGHDGGNADHPRIIDRPVFIGTGWKPCNTVGTATRGGYPEHRFNLAVARRVARLLEALGAMVAMTRTSDTGVGPCVDVRGRFGAKVGAVLAVSIHANGAASGDRGFFVMRPGWVDGYTDDIYARSAALARAMRGGLAAAGLPQANYYTSTGIRKRRDLGTLNMSDVPIVMLELGNMRNAADARRMTSDAGKDRYASGIVGGIRRFLGR